MNDVLVLSILGGICLAWAFGVHWVLTPKGKVKGHCPHCACPYYVSPSKWQATCDECGTDFPI